MSASKPTVDLHKQKLAEYERTLGPDHPTTLAARDDLARAHRTMEQREQAIPLLERILTHRQRKLGPDHPDTLAARDTLTRAYQTTGRTKQVIPLLKETLTDRQRILGPDHPDILAAHDDLARDCWSVEREERAASSPGRVLTGFTRMLGIEHPAARARRNELRHARLFKQSTSSCVSEVILAHQPDLIRLALALVGARRTAEDVVQDAFIALHRRWDRLTDYDQVLPYLRTAVLRRCRAVHRRQTITRRFTGGQEAPFWSPWATPPLDETHREVFLAVYALPRRRREAVVLRYYLDLPEPDIAEAMRISRGTVASALSRALKTLAAKLEGNR
ncbi:sigma-70 family RNA polymerase sigma factor [Streptosporangium sp. NPDC051023]|uniref:RNA polymerase sigma factor n=1 Tax=Streptosporangium sp. NPDC051023 TaxID=3155410 RepID=UPI00344FF61F